MKSILLAAMFCDIDALPPRIMAKQYVLKDVTVFAPIKTPESYRFDDQDLCEIFWDEELLDCRTPDEGPPSPDSEPEDHIIPDEGDTPTSTPPNTPTK